MILQRTHSSYSPLSLVVRLSKIGTAPLYLPRSDANRRAHRIGEFSLIRDIFEGIEVAADGEEETKDAKDETAKTTKAGTSEKTSESQPSPSVEKSSTNYDSQPTYSETPITLTKRPAIKDKSEEDSAAEAANLTKAEKEKLAKKKAEAKRKELLALYEEQKKRREERVKGLADKLVDRVSIWTETDKSLDVTKAFMEKIQLEIEGLKLESYGVEILHAIGYIYLHKASNFLKSQKFFGITGFFGRVKERFTSAKDKIDTIMIAFEAQKNLTQLQKEKDEKGEEMSREKEVEFEKQATDQILGAAWGAHRYEIRDILRQVCDKVLEDKTVKLEKRVERAQALLIIGDLCQKVNRKIFSIIISKY